MKLRRTGVTIKKPSHLGEEYFKKSIRDPYLNTLIDNIEARFDDQSVMASFDIYNPAKLPKLSHNPSKDELESFSEFGNHEVETLAHQFNGIVADPIECLEEWSSFRQFLMENCSTMKLREIISNLCSHPPWQAIYPNMSTLAKICRVVPIHTVVVERTFHSSNSSRQDFEIE